jgi:spore germination protein GerM
MRRTDRKKHRGGKTLLLVAFIAAAAILGTLMLQKYLARHQTGPVHVRPHPAGTSSLSLFFASPDGRGLVRETRKVEACDTDTANCLRATLEELANGPLGDLAPTIPANSTFRSIRVQGDIAVVDLGKEFADSLPKASSAEMTAVYSIINTISFNFPAIKKVKFLLEGHEITTIGGHLELDKPLEPDFRLELKEG